MQPQVDQNIVNLLKQYSAQGLTFYQAKEKLVASGYKEEDIQLAADDYQYGAKPASPNPATAIFEKDPKDAQKVGQDILKEQKKDREIQAEVDGIAGQAGPDIQSDVKYQNKFLFEIGMSWWTWLVIESVIFGVIYWLHLPQILYSVIK